MPVARFLLEKSKSVKPQNCAIVIYIVIKMIHKKRCHGVAQKTKQTAMVMPVIELEIGSGDS